MWRGEVVFGAGQGRFGWKKIADRRAYAQDIAVPELEEMVINLNDPQLSFKDIMAVTGLDEFFCKVAIKARTNEKYLPTTYVNQIWDYHDSKLTEGADPDVFEWKVDQLTSHILQKHIIF